MLLILCSPARAQRVQPSTAPPGRFEIGRRTFFDFGPPFDFYELFIVRPAESATYIERITLTPASDECIAPAKFETASASLNQPISAVLGANPCAIPEKDLRRELRRCKKCMVSSGANITMQVNCGIQTRLIRADVLDRDMFDSAAKTPEHTAWTMQLLERLDQAVGPGVMNKPILSVPEKSPPLTIGSRSATEQELGAGRYDALFPGAAEKVSELYHASQTPPSRPAIELVRSIPVVPKEFVAPEYPPLAKMTHAHGLVSFSVDVDDQGAASNLIFESGSALFYGAVRNAVTQWQFPSDAFGVQIHAAIGFGLGCPPKVAR